jgi:hypothetical protein
MADMTEGDKDIKGVKEMKMYFSPVPFGGSRNSNSNNGKEHCRCHHENFEPSAICASLYITYGI